MLTLNTKYQSASVTTDQDGFGYAVFRVPGDFISITPNGHYDTETQSYIIDNGRMISSIRVLPKEHKVGDMVKSIEIIDEFGVISVSDRARYPHYPILRTTNDLEGGGAYIPAAGFLLDRGVNAFFIPSGVCLKINVQKADAVEATFGVTITWFSEE